MSGLKYVIARNKLTRLIDVIDIKAGKVVSQGHTNHDAAEAEAARLLSLPSTTSGGAA